MSLKESPHGFDPRDSTKNQQGPGDIQKRPDSIIAFPSNEGLDASFAKAVELTREVFHEDRFQTHFTEMKKSFPLTYDHSMGVATIAGYLAIASHLPEDKQYRIIAGAANHDIGKLAYPHIRWDSPKWSPDEQRENDHAVKSHSAKSAEMITDIEPSLVPIVRYHHSFQKTPYPVLDVSELTEDEITALLFTAVGDQVEAIFTRTDAIGCPKTDDEMQAILEEHVYMSPSGESVRAFSDDVIKVAMNVYHMLHPQNYSQAA